MKSDIFMQTGKKDLHIENYSNYINQQDYLYIFPFSSSRHILF